MTHNEYQESQEIDRHGYGFYAIVMAAMLKADTANTHKLKHMWPWIYDELEARHNATGGHLSADFQPW